jgi:hypothetical protein
MTAARSTEEYPAAANGIAYARSTSQPFQYALKLVRNPRCSACLIQQLVRSGAQSLSPDIS